MADNTATLLDEDADYSDWIELYNPTAEAIDLSGWYLSDNPDDLIKWIFPQVTIASHEYILVFTSGKNQSTNELHTNFKLSSSGEWIILTKPDGKSVQFELQFTGQYPDISIGYLNQELIYMDKPTPGLPNIFGDFIMPPTFSKQAGLFDTPFDMEINGSVNGGAILYTLDGSEPDLEQGLIYEEPLTIDSTIVVRAIIEKLGNISRVATSTYIFPAQVKGQPYRPEGYPGNWGDFSKIEGVAPADYMMDPEICESAEYKELLVPALLSIPTISLSTDKNNFFSHSTDPNTGGIYIHTAESAAASGKDWERPVSIEYLLDEKGQGFQIDGGIRIHGGASRVPEKNPKHSFRLVFKNEYGPKLLNYEFFDNTATSSFNSLVLRAGFNQTWLHWDDKQRERGQYINDSWVKDIYRKMGHISAHNKFAHLYINGLYWGLYNISERMDDDFMDYYLDGTKEDFDVIKDYAEVAEGNDDAWNTMMGMAAKGLSDAVSYYSIQGKYEYRDDDPSIDAFLDVENLIDYMILNFYIGNLDWDHHNWVAARNRLDPGKGFQFFPWDSERTFNGKNDNVIDENNEGRPSYIFSQLKQNPVFRIQFTKRANELLGPSGLLSPDTVIATWQKRSSEIELAIIAESARWGDYRRDAHLYKKEPYELYTKNDHWLKEQDRLMNDYFPSRSQIVLDQLKEHGLAGDVITVIMEENDLLSRQDHNSFPNPFNEFITIQYHSQIPGNIKIDVYSKDGQLIDHLWNGYTQELLEINWKPQRQQTGLYYYRLETDDNVLIGKMVYIN